MKGTGGGDIPIFAPILFCDSFVYARDPHQMNSYKAQKFGTHTPLTIYKNRIFLFFEKKMLEILSCHVDFPISTRLPFSFILSYHFGKFGGIFSEHYYKKLK